MDKVLLKELEIDIREAVSKYKKIKSEADPTDTDLIEFCDKMIESNKNILEELKASGGKKEKIDVEKFYNERRNKNVSEKGSNQSKKRPKNH